MLILAGATAMTAAAPEAISFPSTGRSATSEQRRTIALLGIDMAIFSMGRGAGAEAYRAGAA